MIYAGDEYLTDGSLDWNDAGYDQPDFFSDTDEIDTALDYIVDVLGTRHGLSLSDLHNLAWSLLYLGPDEWDARIAIGRD